MRNTSKLLKACRRGNRLFRAGTRRLIASWRTARKSWWIIPKATKKRASREPHQAEPYFPSVSDGDRDHLRVAGCFLGNRSGRVRRHHGTLGFRQIDDDESDRLPRYSDLGLLRAERHE